MKAIQQAVKDANELMDRIEFIWVTITSHPDGLVDLEWGYFESNEKSKAVETRLYHDELPRVEMQNV